MLSTLLFPYSSSSMFCFAAYRCFIKNLYMFSSVLLITRPFSLYSLVIDFCLKRTDICLPKF